MSIQYFDGSLGVVINFDEVNMAPTFVKELELNLKHQLE